MNTIPIILVLCFCSLWILVWALDTLIKKYINKILCDIPLVSAGAVKPLGSVKLELPKYFQSHDPKLHQGAIDARVLLNAQDIVAVSGSSMKPKGCFDHDIVMLDRAVLKKDLKSGDLIVIKFHNEEGQLISKIRQFVRLDGDRMITGTYQNGEWRLSSPHPDDNLHALLLGRIGNLTSWQPSNDVFLESFSEAEKTVVLPS